MPDSRLDSVEVVRPEAAEGGANGALESATAEAPPETRQRLLEAAGRVFAEKGFEQATVRDICGLAGANVASVKYHFGGKTELYQATMLHFAAAELAKYPPDMDLPPDPTPAQRLHAFIRSALYRILDESPDAIHGRLMAREMVEPTGALDAHVAATIRPMSERLRQIVHGLRPDLDEPAQRRTMGSIMGQVLFYKHCRPVMEKLFPGHAKCPADIDALAEHITRFTLGGLGCSEAARS